MLGVGTGYWQLYDLKLDPFEANDLFELDRKSSQGRKVLERQKVERALSGEVKELYIKYGYNLAAAAVDIFKSYMDLEMAKGYQGPTYPHKMWSTIFEQFSHDARDDAFLAEIGFIKPNSKIYSKDYCEDLNLLRTRFDNFRSNRNFTVFHQKRNKLWNEMDIRHVNKYF